jgi:hypothetical protein
MEPLGFGRRRRSTIALFAAGGMVALGLAACGGDGAQPGQLDGRDPNFGVREFGLTDQEWTSAIEQVQSTIADCMDKAGFEYIPADVETVELAMSAVRTEPGVDREDYKKQWGYGVTTRFDNRVKEIELGEQNLAIYASLSEADQVAYDRTLYGDDPDATFAFMFDEEGFEAAGGCTLEAIESSFTDEQLDPDFVNPKDILVEQDGRVAAADLEWMDCMGEAGYDYEDQDEIIEEYGQRLDELLDGEEPEALPPAKAAQLAELQQEEIAVSLVDLECQILYVDDVIREVEIELFGRVVSG